MVDKHTYLWESETKQTMKKRSFLCVGALNEKASWENKKELKIHDTILMNKVNENLCMQSTQQKQWEKQKQKRNTLLNYQFHIVNLIGWREQTRRKAHIFNESQTHGS